MRILDARQMREADRRTIEDLGVPAATLMERAGLGVADTISAVLGPVAGRRVAVLAGRGNNGGDAFVVARVLADRGANVLVALVGRHADLRGDAREKARQLVLRGVDIIELGHDDDWRRIGGDVQACDIVVDGIVGTGFAPPLRGVAAAIAEDLAAAGIRAVAIDLPSGLSADSAAIDGPVVPASFTVALAALKRPLIEWPAASLAGRVVLTDIGIPDAVIEAIDGPRLDAVTRDDAKRLVPVRPLDSHKGQFGHVLIVAGSRGKTGAAVLAARGALRSGAGLVTVATPASLLPIVAAHDPEVMTAELPETPEGTVAEGASSVVRAIGADVVAIGPGMGRGEGVTALVEDLLGEEARLVIDADALNAIASRGPAAWRDRRAAVIVTPHPGEMARLAACATADVQARRAEAARDLASVSGAVVVLKGHRTVVASPDGRLSFNMSGNPGMATAGSGDVLAGVIAACWAGLGEPTMAARLGVYVHGLAGDLAAREAGEIGLVAGDIAAKLGPATLALQGRRPTEDLG